MNLSNLNPFKKTEQKTPVTEQNFDQAVESFIWKKEGNSFLTEAGRNMIVSDIIEHVASGTSKDEILKDMSSLSQGKFIDKYKIDRRSPEQKMEDEMNTVALHVREVMMKKGYTEFAIDSVISKSAEELAEDPKGFIEKLEEMSKDDIDKNYFNLK